ncbi:hypothetical protein BUALT_Bualt07G0012400 [Buddleja alternifolia]|uniref:Disease resistance N-terminal domain-containing protein n=1 Tax=Buddleja alternifolia TaxID=168488 RepID=A0AAV6X8J1_9LAMI|nr:hypothetical protein BUALT_Bualt07G0012400 [Buddleja alternifolia]
MKQQLLFAFKFVAIASAYVFTRSRTPINKRRNPEKAIAVLFLLENLKRTLLYNGQLIRDAKNQVEMLENDINLFKAFLKDAERIRYKDEAVEGLVRRIQELVREGENMIVVYSNQAEENRNWLRIIGVAKEVKVIRAKVKSIYDESRILFASGQIEEKACFF